MYAWEPEPFSNDSLEDPEQKFAQEAMAALGRVPDPNYIGVTCEGEVCSFLVHSSASLHVFWPSLPACCSVISVNGNGNGFC